MTFQAQSANRRRGRRVPGRHGAFVQIVPAPVLTHLPIFSLSYALNYKGLKYRTEWVDYPDIEAICKKYGAPPTRTEAPFYTLPMIYDPATKTAVVESMEIARYLDRTYPDTPKLLPSDSAALQAAFMDTVLFSIMLPLFLNIAYDVWATLLPRGKVHFRESREQMFGGKLEDLRSDKHWEECEAAFGKLDAWLKLDESEGEIIFLGGENPNHCDLTIGALLIWARTVCGSESEAWRKIASWHNGRWARMEKLLQQYAYVEDEV